MAKRSVYGLGRRARCIALLLAALYFAAAAHETLLALVPAASPHAHHHHGHHHDHGHGHENGEAPSAPADAGEPSCALCVLAAAAAPLAAPDPVLVRVDIPSAPLSWYEDERHDAPMPASHRLRGPPAELPA